VVAMETSAPSRFCAAPRYFSNESWHPRSAR
jgi:hypothetical protein